MDKSCLFILLVLLFAIPVVNHAQQSFPLPLIDFENKFHVTSIGVNDAKSSLLRKDNNHILQVRLGHQSLRPSVTLTLPVTDLSAFIGIAMDITNTGSASIAIEAQCFNDTASLSIKDGARFYYRSMIVLEPGETDSLLITFSRSMESLPSYIKKYFSGMFGLPGGFVRRKENIDLTKITKLSVFKQQSGADYTFNLDNIRAVGKYELPDSSTLENGFFPIVDQFGQYIHNHWVNKVSSINDILAQQKEEEADLKANPGAKNWDIYGGWMDGPSLNATGHFRVEKYQNKWWLVDPLGKLFWSQGINIIATSQRVPTQGREKYFATIPQGNDFYKTNLLIKYGNNWTTSPLDTASKIIHKRLRSWGINTLAANSDPYLYTYKKTPYTIEIRSGIASPIPDTINEAAFRKLLNTRLQRSDIVQAANDPWCIGYFVDNEIAWPLKNTTAAINKYFQIVQEELKKFAPNKLYLGCRINSPNFNRIAFEAAAKYCDVISINHYDYNLSDFRETAGLDKPVIVGEFHFGALDCGLLHPGLRSVANQKQRGRVYEHFVSDALKSPIIVGVHWFQYTDQICTGRNDGENYQIGFVDICDRPYPEMVSAAREIGSHLYTFRQAQTNGNAQ